MRVLWAPSALRQIGQIYDYLVAFNPSAATQVAQALLKTGDDLVNFPHRGRPVAHTELREVISAYPYVIRYHVLRDTVRILRVRHAARQPTSRAAARD